MTHALEPIDQPDTFQSKLAALIKETVDDYMRAWPLVPPHRRRRQAYANVVQELLRHIAHITSSHLK